MSNPFPITAKAVALKSIASWFDLEIAANMAEARKIAMKKKLGKKAKAKAIYELAEEADRLEACKRIALEALETARRTLFQELACVFPSELAESLVAVLFKEKGIAKAAKDCKMPKDRFEKTLNAYKKRFSEELESLEEKTPK